MITDEMTEALNTQINAELYSSYLYLSMSSYAAHIGFKGAANWFSIQAREEMLHAEKLFNYVNSQGKHVKLQAIAQPPTEFESLNDMFEKTAEHEALVTSMINDLMDLALKQRDHATSALLQWFVTEQVEEEESVGEMLSMVKMAGDGGGLFMVDRELSARTFTPPTDPQSVFAV